MYPGGPTGAGGGAATADGCERAASGVPQTWQKALPSGFWVPQRPQVSGIYPDPEDSARGLRARLREAGAAVTATPQIGQKADATSHRYELRPPNPANPIWAASS